MLALAALWACQRPFPTIPSSASVKVRPWEAPGRRWPPLGVLALERAALPGIRRLHPLLGITKTLLSSR